MMRPLTLALSLALAAPAFAQTAAPVTPAAKDEAPAARDILNKAIEAAGGTDAVKAVKSMHVMVNTETGNNPVKYEIYTSGPTKSFVHVNANGIQIQMGRNGDVAWMKMGAAQKVDASNVEQAANPARLNFSWTSIADRYKSIETTGSVDVNDDDCWRVRFADPKEKPADGIMGARYISFSKRTGLPARFEIPQANGTMMQIIVSDYKKFGDLMMFTRMRQVAQRGQKMSFEKIEFNTVDDSIFEAPAGIAPSTSQPGGE